MKKLLLTLTITAGLAASALAQGILVDNTLNTDATTAATAGGLVWIKTAGPTYTLFDGTLYNVGIELSAGSSSGSLSSLGTILPGVGGTTYTGNDAGKIQQFPAVTWDTGVGNAAGTAWVQLKVWTFDTPLASGALTYATATGSGDYRGTVLFQNATSKSTAPALPDQGLGGMPALILTAVPEPSTVALAGLGLASLLIFRRRK